jgi:hypothetical protein
MKLAEIAYDRKEEDIHGFFFFSDLLLCFLFFSFIFLCQSRAVCFILCVFFLLFIFLPQRGTFVEELFCFGFPSSIWDQRLVMFVLLFLFLFLFFLSLSDFATFPHCNAFAALHFLPTACFYVLCFAFMLLLSS